jgi:hypothetical protein
MAALVKAGVLSAEAVTEIAQEAHNNCVVELMSDEKESRKVFDRFACQFESEVK